jgi:DNA polymerase mu
LIGETRNSERFQALSLFASIYGIGPFNARKLYDLGVRTIEDLERYYDLPTRGVSSQGDVDLDTTTAAFSPHVIEDELTVRTPNGKVVPLQRPGMNNAPPDMSIKIALMMREDFEVPIPREEVEEIHRVVMGELEKIQPGCISTIVGRWVSFNFYDDPFEKKN